MREYYFECRLCRRGPRHCGANHRGVGVRLRGPDLQEEEEGADVHKVLHYILYFTIQITNHVG